MKYCIECGSPLELRTIPDEGPVPYCPACRAFRFPNFNVNCSMIVMNPKKDHIALIRQYGGSEYILVAGYVRKGEDAEDTVVREVNEELGVRVTNLKFNRTHYFPPSNTLMVNFTVTIDTEDLQPNEEIDSYQWFTLEEARVNIKKGGLAQIFLNGYLDGLKETEYQFPDAEEMKLV
ncbi:MAG: NUDIX domain-containing protein [Eubacterium sp.]|jgi:NAD+ diphosphatase